MSRQTLFGPFTQLIKVSLDSIILGVCCTKAISLFPQTIVLFSYYCITTIGCKKPRKSAILQATHCEGNSVSKSKASYIN